MDKSKSSQRSKSVDMDKNRAGKNTVSSCATSTSVATIARRVSSKQHNKAQIKNTIKRNHRPSERQARSFAQHHARRNKMFTWTTVVLLIAVLSGLGYWLRQAHISSTHAANSSWYQESIYTSLYPPIDHVYCDPLEDQVTHIHAHVSIYINGERSLIPQFVGIAQDNAGDVTCYYWLHTHDASGVIHIESPASARETFTFGQFVDVWQQEFSTLGFPSQLLLQSGWTIWINGHRYPETLTSIPLARHSLIRLAYNSPDVKPDTTYAWNGL